MERFSLAANSLTQIEAMLEIICVVTVQSNYNSLFLSGNVLSKHNISSTSKTHLLQTFSPLSQNKPFVVSRFVPIDVLVLLRPAPS